MGNYLAEFNKSYENQEEFAMRVERYVAVDSFIQEHNQTNASYTVGHNQFSDWTAAEYKSILGYKRDELKVSKTPKKFDTSTNASSVNWVDAGAVTPVKDQGQCGSCWAFSTTGSLEGAHFVASGELLSFSEQQLVDCATIRYGNMGCNGGLQDNAYKYYMKTGDDAMLESSYPYTSGGGDDSTDCLYDASQTSSVTVSSYVDVTPSSPSQMMAAL